MFPKSMCGNMGFSPKAAGREACTAALKNLLRKGWLLLPGSHCCLYAGLSDPPVTYGVSSVQAAQK